MEHGFKNWIPSISGILEEAFRDCVQTPPPHQPAVADLERGEASANSQRKFFIGERSSLELYSKISGYS
jgi:hypothetical protein